MDIKVITEGQADITDTQVSKCYRACGLRAYIQLAPGLKPGQVTTYPEGLSQFSSLSM